MLKEIRIPKPFSLETFKIIADNDKLQPSSEIKYETYYIIEREKPKSLPPKDFEVLIPFLGSPKKVKFKCPKCNKQFNTMADIKNNKVDCDIKFCSTCGQKLDWNL